MQTSLSEALRMKKSASQCGSILEGYTVTVSPSAPPYKIVNAQRMLMSCEIRNIGPCWKPIEVLHLVQHTAIFC